MKKILFVLIACFIFVIPVMGQDIKPTPIDEMSGLSNQQLLTVYDAVVSEIQKRGVDTSAQTLRDSSIIFGQNIHIQTGQLSVCLTPQQYSCPSPLPPHRSFWQGTRHLMIPRPLWMALTSAADRFLTSHGTCSIPAPPPGQRITACASSPEPTSQNPVKTAGI